MPKKKGAQKKRRTSHRRKSNVPTKGTPSISLCMIVKDEEDLLPQCLASVQKIVDEIIVVDTGSSDRTVEIAKRFGAKVYHHPWNNDFAGMRNRSLGYVTGDWILVLDADEELKQEDVGRFRRLMQHANKFDACFFRVQSELRDGYSELYSIRLFRNGCGAHYEDIVHNQLILTGRATSADIRIHHRGYNLDPEKMKAKQERTGALLRKQVKEEPENSYAYYQLGRVCFQLGHLDEAIAASSRCLELVKQKYEPVSFHLSARFDMAQAYFAKGQFEAAMEICQGGLEEKPDFMDLLFILGNSLLRLKKYQEAIEAYQRYIEAWQKNQTHLEFTHLSIESMGQAHAAYYYMGSAYHQLGKLEQAIACFQKSLIHKEDNPAVIRTMRTSYLALGDLEAATTWCTYLIERNEATSKDYAILAEIHAAQKQYSKAARCFQQALALDPGSPDFHADYGLMLFQWGRLQEAEEQFRMALASDKRNSRALLGLLRMLQDPRCSADPGEVIQRVLSADDPRVFRVAGGVAVGVKAYPLAIACYEQYLQHHPMDANVLADLATCYGLMRQWEAARSGYQAALSFAPGNEKARRGLQAIQSVCSLPQVS